MPASNPLVRNCVERGEKVPNSHPVNVLISLNMHGGNKVEENIDSDDAQALSAEEENLSNFYVIAREVVKPLRPEFALEICYMFDCIIRNAPDLRNQSVARFEEQIEQQLLLLVKQKKQHFKNLLKRRQSLIDKFCNKFTKCLSGLFRLS